MAITKSSSATLLLAFLFSLLLQRPIFAVKKSYVVYLGGHSHDAKESSLQSSKRVRDSHDELLASVLGNEEKARDAIFYSYTRYINGFAANLEEDEALAISKHPRVVSVFPNRAYELHTTRSWNFLHLERDGRVPKESLWVNARFGEDIIIGNIDTGVWPESQSFKDDGMGPVPSKWKGICQNDQDKNFSCNRKLIGARYFNKGFSANIQLNASFNTPRDVSGHGTHTLSTAGGGFVPAANVFGYGNGTAKGGSPRARVAAYKVCWVPFGTKEYCFDADIMAAFDAAIQDGVDVISVSLGASPSSYFADSVAIGSFHAVKNGITVVCSAGNSGPEPRSVTNIAPWVITVAASTMDRGFPAYVNYGNKSVQGQSLSQNSLPGNKLYPMISSREAPISYATPYDAELCLMGSLDPEKVTGKIVVCRRGVATRTEKGGAVLHAGGIGMVLVNDETTGNDIIVDPHVLPATHISYFDGLALYDYLNSTESPLGYITKPVTQLDKKPAPIMTFFSSQGPNSVNVEILKPDITAPGASVVAAYTGAAGPSALTSDTRRVAYNIMSGTSMSCPHIAGVVGLLRTLHPDWSPSAIKSAIMTTARTQDNIDEPVLNSSYVKATPFNYGSGHVRPNRAMDPGLVYDLTTNDYLNFLCALGYNATKMALFSNGSYSCPSEPPKLEDLNYPSIILTNLYGNITVSRTLKNVGSPGTYIARVREPESISVSVNPTSLTFGKIGEEKKFEVILKVKVGQERPGYVFGGLTWSDGKHYVRTPLVVNAFKRGIVVI